MIEGGEGVIPNCTFMCYLGWSYDAKTLYARNFDQEEWIQPYNDREWFFRYIVFQTR